VVENEREAVAAKNARQIGAAQANVGELPIAHRVQLRDRPAVKCGTAHTLQRRSPEMTDALQRRRELIVNAIRDG
jgi:hypothetical protein